MRRWRPAVSPPPLPRRPGLTEGATDRVIVYEYECGEEEEEDSYDVQLHALVAAFGVLISHKEERGKRRRRSERRFWHFKILPSLPSLKLIWRPKHLLNK